jgi:hypothetical protein
MTIKLRWPEKNKHKQEKEAGNIKNNKKISIESGTKFYYYDI